MYGNTSFDNSALGKEEEEEEEEDEGEEVVGEEQEEHADLGESPRCEGGDAVDRDNCLTVPPPPPIVWPSPAFTRDMQVGGGTAYIQHTGIAFVCCTVRARQPTDPSERSTVPSSQLKKHTIWNACSRPPHPYFHPTLSLHHVSPAFLEGLQRRG